MAIQVAVVAAWAALVDQVVGYFHKWQKRRAAAKLAKAEKALADAQAGK